MTSSICYPGDFSFVYGSMSASRLKHFLVTDGRVTPNKMHRLFYAYLELEDKNMQRKLTDTMKDAMVRGQVYEKCALQYLIDHKIVTSLYSPPPLHQFSEKTNALMASIKRIGTYKVLSEQQKVFDDGLSADGCFDLRDFSDVTCVGKSIQVLPDALATYRDANVVVEVKCPSRFYHPSERRKHLLQLMMVMKAYDTTSAIYVEYLTNTTNYQEMPNCHVCVYLVPFDQQLYNQIKTCMRALDTFALKRHQETNLSNIQYCDETHETFNHLYRCFTLLDNECKRVVKQMIQIHTTEQTRIITTYNTPKRRTQTFRQHVNSIMNRRKRRRKKKMLDIDTLRF